MPSMRVSSSAPEKKSGKSQRDRSFGTRAGGLKERQSRDVVINRGGVGEKEVSFTPARKERKGERKVEYEKGEKKDGKGWKDRRSASGNVFRGM